VLVDDQITVQLMSIENATLYSGLLLTLCGFATYRCLVFVEG
jgi:hypothetical protein